MKIIIAGGSGFIGRALIQSFDLTRDSVIVLSRNPQATQKSLPENVRCLTWDGLNTTDWQNEIDSQTVLINLVGENVGQIRWSSAVKKRILDSRVIAGQAIVKAAAQAKEKPRLLIQSSGISYYGNVADIALSEESPQGAGYLADVSRQWEAGSAEIEKLGVRRVIMRTGLVLGQGGGLLKKMVLPYQLFIGGPLGSGRQVLSWIHLEDLIRAIHFFMEKDHLKGVFNLTAPDPVTMDDFSKTLGAVLRRPAIFRVPGFVLKLLLGEMAEETVLTGQRVIPAGLLKADFTFKYPQLQPALQSILR